MVREIRHYCHIFKGSVCEKWKGVQAYAEKYSMVMTTNLSSICCVYKEKMINNDSYRGMQRPYQRYIESRDTQRPTNRCLNCIIHKTNNDYYDPSRILQLSEFVFDATCNKLYYHDKYDLYYLCSVIYVIYVHVDPDRPVRSVYIYLYY